MKNTLLALALVLGILSSHSIRQNNNCPPPNDGSIGPVKCNDTAPLLKF